MGHTNLGIHSSKPTLALRTESAEAPAPETKQKVGKSPKLETVDVVEIRNIEQQSILPCLKSRVAVELLSKHANLQNKANWSAIFQFSKDLEDGIDNMFRNPEMLTQIDSIGVNAIRATLTRIGQELHEVQKHRRSGYKEIFSPFMPRYRAETKIFDFRFARLYTAILALNAICAEKVKHE